MVGIPTTTSKEMVDTVKVHKKIESERRMIDIVTSIRAYIKATQDADPLLSELFFDVPKLPPKKKENLTGEQNKHLEEAHLNARALLIQLEDLYKTLIRELQDKPQVAAQIKALNFNIANQTAELDFLGLIALLSNLKHLEMCTVSRQVDSPVILLCKNLETLTLAGKVDQYLIIDGFPELIEINLGLKTCSTVHIHHCNKLASVHFDGLLSLLKLDLTANNKSLRINAYGLKSLQINDDNHLIDLSMENIRSMRELDLNKIKDLEKLVIINCRMKELTLTQCRKLKDFELQCDESVAVDLSACTVLQRVALNRFRGFPIKSKLQLPKLHKVPDFSAQIYCSQHNSVEHLYVCGVLAEYLPKINFTFNLVTNAPSDLNEIDLYGEVGQDLFKHFVAVANAELADIPYSLKDAANMLRKASKNTFNSGVITNILSYYDEQHVFQRSLDRIHNLPGWRALLERFCRYEPATHSALNENNEKVLRKWFAESLEVNKHLLTCQDKVAILLKPLYEFDYFMESYKHIPRQGNNLLQIAEKYFASYDSIVKYKIIDRLKKMLAREAMELAELQQKFEVREQRASPLIWDYPTLEETAFDMSADDEAHSEIQQERASKRYKYA